MATKDQSDSFYRVFAALRDAFEAEAPGIGKVITADKEEGFLRVWIGGELVRVYPAATSPAGVPE